ncbi:UvrD-helicase domain-containing protein [Actinomyces sp. oral taxon 171]|uniref:UvrD-helicase domain-containing protein n=2 Tax=Actinomyces sp. oral taxon 171 TaxID=706438 RepID=UPI0010FC1490|nr:UvrD-helicase domain-containing protein [Actinomyces sp. oral taxon 171]QCT32426.1 ATP-dependent helicase [Actinomyces sp. oral taxon 171 str. F0337]
MATILLPSSKTKDATAKDPSLRAKIGPFISKLSTMSTSSGLHLEPIRGSRDRRVRTARVTDFYRAVLFELTADGEVVYVIHGIWPHDEAIKIAESVTVHVNPRNGITEVVNVGDLIGLDPRAVEEARRTAQAELAAAQREADEIARETARIQAANAEARRRNEEARGADAGSAPTQAPGEPVGTGGQRGEGGAVAGTAGAAAVPGAVVVPSRDQAPVWPDGLTVEMLHDELGIDVRLGAAALAAQRESQLLDLASTARVSWQGEALLNLATGATIEEIREDFGLRPSRDVSAEPTDADLIAGLRTRAARSTFTWLESDEDLRRAIEGLSFAEWQLFLHPQQRALVERRANGPMRVSGGAGTGKTVIAVHRAVELAKRDKADGQEPRILLTTYTRNLADDLRRQIAQLEPRLPFTERLSEPGVMVSGLDRVARMILQQAGARISPIAQEVIGQPRGRVLTYPRENVWQEVLTLMGDELPEGLRSADFLESEYELIVLPQRVTTLKQYLRVRRPGRGVALDRSKRAAVWKAMERYRDRSADLGVTSFDEQLALAAAWLDQEANLGTPRPFRHVLVDEAQDLTPAHLQLLRALVEPGPDDLFLAEDSHQRIYGKKITLSHYGIQVRGRSRRLTRNYRTTRQNLDVAFGILDPGTYEDMEGQAEEHHYVSPRSGPEPLLLHATDRADELSKAAELLTVWLEQDRDSEDSAPETIAVLVRDRYQRDAVVNGLAQHGIEVRAVDREAAGRGRPVVMTMHRAKGLEFRKVLLFDVSRKAIPRPLRDQQYSDADRDDALLRERSLLYVAATRARDQLAISWSGEASPLITALTP